MPHRGQLPDLMEIAAAVVGSAAAAQVIEPAPIAALDVHAALNTYEVEPDVAPGVYRNDPQVSVIGENRRRLIVQRMPDGVWIGGCKVTDPDQLLELANVLAFWAADGWES
jgi:hypothetical protein